MLTCIYDEYLSSRQSQDRSHERPIRETQLIQQPTMYKIKTTHRKGFILELASFFLTVCYIL